jgi:transcriptional regulator with XRE-family HTH domain
MQREDGSAALFSLRAAAEKKRSHSMLDESRREALGRFLRERRQTLAPEQVGISSHRGRRTPGLRREEVAFLADIGVKWYARLEAGDDVHPSMATLTGIAVALRLSSSELEYMLELAGLHQPSVASLDAGDVPVPLSALVRTLRGVSATLHDRILTPLMWNSIAETLHGHSRFANPTERNGLVRSLFDPECIAFLGSEREEFIRHAVGMFRLNQSSPSPSPFGAAVYEKVKDEPLFQAAWQRRVVASELSCTKTCIRNHATAGKLVTYAADLTSLMQNKLLLRVLMPADHETATKFSRLEKIRESLTYSSADLSYA